MFNVYLQSQHSSHLAAHNGPLSPLPLLLTPLLLHVTKILPNHLPSVSRINSWQMITQIIVNFFKMFQRHRPPTLIVTPDAVLEHPGDDAMNQPVKQHLHTLWLRVPRSVTIFGPNHRRKKQFCKSIHALSGEAPPCLFSPFVHTHRLSFHMSSLVPHSPSQALLSTNINTAG